MQHHRVRRGIVESCCLRECSNSDIRKYCYAESPPVEVEEQDEELSTHRPQYTFHFNRDDRLAEEMSQTPPPTKSRVQIGRVPQDYTKQWTYTSG